DRRSPTVTDPTPPPAPTAPGDGPRAFVHQVCGGTTEMPAEQIHGRLTNPHGYNDWVHCAKCDGFVSRHECRWVDTAENLAEFFGRAKATAPPPPESKVVYAVPVVLAALGAIIGSLILDGSHVALGAVIGFALGVLLVVLRKYGVR